MTETLTHTIGSAGRLAILSREDLEKLDGAALEVLADVGVAVPSERARAALVATARRRTAYASRCRPSSCAGW